LDSNPSISIKELQDQRSRAYKFERLVAKVFHDFGFAVLGGATGPDAGLDLVARRANPKTGDSTFYIVECKSSLRPLTKDQIKQFAEKISQYCATSGILVTDAKLTPAAIQTAQSLAISVFSIDELDRLAEELKA
jgi:hypothetical protein